MKRIKFAISVILVIFAMTFGITSCVKQNKDGSIKLTEDELSANPTVVVIDSCEYISWGYKMAHKGNCKYCAERRRKEYEAFLEDIIIELY